MGKCIRPIETCQFKANCSGLKKDYTSPNCDVPTGCSYLWIIFFIFFLFYFYIIAFCFCFWHVFVDSAWNQFINREKTYQPVVCQKHKLRKEVVVEYLYASEFR